MLLLHGTKGKGSEGILKEAYEPSIEDEQSHGPCVYMIKDVNIYCDYSESYGHEVVNGENIPKKITYLFVNY